MAPACASGADHAPIDEHYSSDDEDSVKPKQEASENEEDFLLDNANWTGNVAGAVLRAMRSALPVGRALRLQVTNGGFDGIVGATSPGRHFKSRNTLPYYSSAQT